MKEMTLDTGRMPWEKADGYPEGTMRKVLRRNSEGNPAVVLLKLPAGFAMDDHAHVFDEQQYVLEGKYEAQGKRFGAGHYRFIPAHASHGPFLSAAGAVVLVIWES